MVVAVAAGLSNDRGSIFDFFPKSKSKFTTQRDLQR